MSGETNVQPEKIPYPMRDTLFGDLPFSQWPPFPLASGVAAREPWISLLRAKRLFGSGDAQAAAEALRHVLELPDLESRQYLQAWQFLRELGIGPPSEKEKQLLGVVVEVGMEKGLDLIAAWADHHARYYNFSGAGIVWECPNSSLDSIIDNLLRAGADTIKAVGPWKGSRPPAPPPGQARINLLAPSGLHFGQGPLKDLSRGSARRTCDCGSIPAYAGIDQISKNR